MSSSLASILGALTWKESFDDDEAQSRARVIHQRMKKRRAAAKKAAELKKQRTKPAKLIHHRDGTTSVKVKLAEKFLVPLIRLSRESAVRQSNYRGTSGHQQCVGCRFNKGDSYCQQHDFYLPSGGKGQTCNEWQRRR